MRSRIIQTPALHDARTRGHTSSWLELLFDLILAGTVVSLSDALGQHATAESYGVFTLATCAAWQAWTGFTFFHNRFATDDLAHRSIVLLQLFTVAVLGVSAAAAIRGRGVVFSGAYAVLELTAVVLYVRARRHVSEARDLAGYYAGTYAVGFVVWLAAALAPPSLTRVLWTLGCAVGFSFPVNKRSRELAERRPPDARHVTHRYGVLVLVLLGESLVSVLSGASVTRHGTSLAAVGLTLLIAFCLFWLYFDDVAGADVKEGNAARLVWVYSHFPLALGIATLGAGLSGVLQADGAPTAASRWLVAGGLSLSLVAIAIIDSVTERPEGELGERAHVNARLASSVLALVLAPVGASMRAVEFLTLASVLGVAQVAFDLMLAPAARELDTALAETTADGARRRPSGEPGRSVPPPRVRAPAQALRLGTPTELRRDFYSFFMDGPWSRLLLSLVFGYLALNGFFAGLYLLEPGSLANARPRAFADAFFFSVQTFATIGYGGMTPATPYGNLVVTAEAAVGLLSAAFATGLMFAKAARPRSSALFSRSMILTRRNGVPCLMFRVGNARGNDVIDASISVTALKEEVTQEGHRMRRQHDMSLIRDRTPFFTLSWTVMHEITPDSPLFGIDWNDPAGLVAIVATLTGHDGTYGQTTYARQLYSPSDIRHGHRFIDVLSQLPDGRMMVDYAKFHDTAPDTEHPHPRDTAGDTRPETG